MNKNDEEFKIKIEDWLHFCIAFFPKEELHYMICSELKKQKKQVLDELLRDAYVYTQLELLEKRLMKKQLMEVIA